MRRVVFNQKGGVGKTSITCNLAAAAAAAGRKVLVVDLDAQANATQYLLGRGADEVTKTVADFFEATLGFKLFQASLQDALYSTPCKSLWLIPAAPELAELQPKLEGRYKIYKLREAIEPLVAEHGFDAVYFDTPPALNFYSMSALIAAERVLIPFDCDAFSGDALRRVMEVIQEVAADHQPTLAADGVVINHFQAQARLPQEAIQKLEAQGFTILRPYLSSSIVMRESHAAHTPLAFFKPRHKLALEFNELAEHLHPRRPAAVGKTSKTTRKSAKNSELSSARF
jgi:chromosome partitioning protein